MMKKIVYLAIFVFGGNLLIAAAQNAPSLKPLKTWTGEGVDNQHLNLLNKKSASGESSNEAIFNEVDWRRLWQAWRDDEVPKIDFAKNIIVFCTTRTPNHCSINLKLSASGDLKIARLTTLIGSNAETFDYKIVLIKRAGIKSINGKSIAPGKKCGGK